MIGNPGNLPDRTEVGEPGAAIRGHAKTMDILSDVLCSVRLSGAIFFEVDAYAPWVSEAPLASQLAPMAMPEAEHVIEYHVIVEGTCWGAVVGAESAPVLLEPGSVIIFPHGDAHVLSSAPGMRASVDLSIFGTAAERKSLPFHIEHPGSGPHRVNLICGFLGCDLRPFNPLIEALPSFVHVPGGYNPGDGWLRDLIRATLAESRQRRLGNAGVLSRLSELIFIEVVRRYMESLRGETFGWFSALLDPQIGRAIRLLHADLARPWSLAELAREAGVSRTVLIERFNAYVGMAPMSYLARWRMQVAAGMLATGAMGLRRIAAAVGYESEAAFSRAFKRATGQPPAAWRSRAMVGAAAR
jgi:AraC-like DNA-binding protein